MNSFYHHIVERLMAAKNLNDVHLSPLEATALHECRCSEDELRLHDHNFRLMLEDIDRRKREAALYGEGEDDWALDAFHLTLAHKQETARQTEQQLLSEDGLSDRQTIKLQRSREIQLASAVYSCRVQGLSTAETAKQLQVTEDEVTNAERQLVRLYSTSTKNGGEQPRISLASPYAQTRMALQSGTYRLFRQDVTGAVKYRFYCADRLLGTGTALVMPDFPVILCCGGLILNSSFDAEQSIVPGVSRTVIDADNATAEVARLTYLGKGLHELQLNWDTGTVTIRILSQDGKHAFYQDERLIAEIIPLPLPQQMFDWEINYCLRPHEALSDEMGTVLLSFPLLRFAE